MKSVRRNIIVESTIFSNTKSGNQVCFKFATHNHIRYRHIYMKKINSQYTNVIQISIGKSFTPTLKGVRKGGNHQINGISGCY